MWRFRLTHSSEGSEISLEESSLWSFILEEIGDWTARRVFPGHKMCCDIPEWAWKIGWGNYDTKDDFWENSLGRCCWRFSTWVEAGFGAWKATRVITKIQVPYSWVQRNFPEMGEPFVSGWSDEESDDNIAV